MCEFCHRHGEGKKWYLAVKNYSEELYTEAAQRSMTDILSPLAGRPTRSVDLSPRRRSLMRRAPWLIRWIARPHQQDVHWGQVVPIEDALQVVDMMDWVVRLPCTCRAVTIGDKNARYCFGIGVAGTEEPIGRLFRQAISPALSVEKLTREQAEEVLIDLDRRGAMHSLWTFKSPFIGGLCNCDRDCGALRSQTALGYQVMFRSEYVARVDPDRCNGCRLCMHQCLFGAMTHSLALGKCAVNDLECYGCGICRAACNREAISLLPRASVPAAAGHWDL